MSAKNKNPNVPTTIQNIAAVRAAFEREQGSVRRTAWDNSEPLVSSLMGIDCPVNTSVEAEGCIGAIPFYHFPENGKLKTDMWHALVSLIASIKKTAVNSIYVWGIPGTGKDALWHHLCSHLRIPSKKFSIIPNTDIQHWLFSQAFRNGETIWTEGELLKAVRDGYVDANGERHPMLILLSDFDRADRYQAETLRTIMDSDNGQIAGPEGKVYPVLPGTIIVATANSMGGGDETGRCISANVMDASLIDRFRTTVQFHPMDWVDERIICENKFPNLHSKHPTALDLVGRVTQAIRGSIEKEEIFTEFSHRAVTKWLTHCDSILELTGTNMQTTSLLKAGFRIIMDGQSDSATRLAIKRLADPVLGTI